MTDRRWEKGRSDAGRPDVEPVSLESVLVSSNRLAELLRGSGWTLAVAESCTGGLLGHVITEVAGSSEYFLFGAVTYSNEAKEIVLGVSGEDLAVYGAVSDVVARAMAEGVAELVAADCSVAITGIAGPGGGSAEKPVGTVYLAALGPWGLLERHERFSGNRSRIKIQAVRTALEMLIEGIGSARREG